MAIQVSKSAPTWPMRPNSVSDPTQSATNLILHRDTGLLVSAHRNTDHWY
jgi:hypothetical protein